MSCIEASYYKEAACARFHSHLVEERCETGSFILRATVNIENESAALFAGFLGDKFRKRVIVLACSENVLDGYNVLSDEGADISTFCVVCVMKPGSFAVALVSCRAIISGG